MSRLEEIKNEYSKEIGFYNWKELAQQYTWGDPDGLQAEMKEICERYVQACCQASLEKASEKAIAIYDGNFLANVDKESITNPDNIVIL